MQGGLRQLPSVDRLLSHLQVALLREEYPHELVADMARRATAAREASKLSPSSGILMVIVVSTLSM